MYMISNVGLSHVLYFPLTGGAILSHASFFCSSSFVTQSASSFLCFQYSIRKYNSIYILKGAVKNDVTFPLTDLGTDAPDGASLRNPRTARFRRACPYGKTGPRSPGGLLSFPAAAVTKRIDLLVKMSHLPLFLQSVHGQRGVRTPYPQAGPFPLSGGHNFSPFSTGLGDSCLSSPSRGTQVS